MSIKGVHRVEKDKYYLYSLPLISGLYKSYDPENLYPLKFGILIL